MARAIVGEPCAISAARPVSASRAQRLTGGRGAGMALGGYVVVSVLCFGWGVLPHLGRSCACTSGVADPSGYMWNLAWWAHALTHGENPFASGAVFAPSHTPLGAEGMLIPGPAVALIPVTLLFGPLVAYNLIMLASPVLAAFFAFLLCRDQTGRFGPSLVGGYVFGFSAYMLGHLAGHANLVIVFPIPVMVQLSLRRIDGRISRGRYIALTGLTFAWLLSCSTELALTSVGFGGVALLAGLALAPAARRRIARALPTMIGAGILGALLASPVILAALRDNVTSGFSGNGDAFGGDLFGYLVPTRLFWLGHSTWSGFAAPFSDGDFVEGGLYVGVPLAFLVLGYLFVHRRTPAARVMALMLAVIGLLTLGSHLHVDGKSTTIALPWLWLSRSGFLNELVPARFGIYTFLIVAIITARWLAEAPPGRAGAASWIAIALALAFVAPDVDTGLWHSRPENPPFFTSGEYRQVLTRGENVLMLPSPMTTDSMLWQAETGMWFRQATGYLGRFTAPAGYARTSFAQQTQPGATPPGAAAVAAFLRERRVGAIVLGRPAGPWPATLARLGLAGRALGGVVVYDVPARLGHVGADHPQNAISSRARPTGSS